MPAGTKDQRSLACMALAMKEGKMDKGKSAQAAKMMESMSMEEMQKMCHTTDEEMMKK